MNGHAIPRGVPAAHEVSSRAVLDLLDAAESAGFDLHSLMVLRHGQVVAEGWWAPYTPDGLQLLYSLSKSFTATAVGLAQAEGLLSVDDHVLDLLPEAAPENPDEHLRALRVRHVLSMATGHRQDTLDKLARDDRGEGVLGIPIEEPPGTWFTYNNGATLLLSRIVTERTGQRLLDYLRPRLLAPLGIDRANWKGTDDVDQGFSGLHLATESVAKLGQLFLQRGMWAGERLLPEEWVAEATRVQVANPREPEIDWRQGYGYQCWMCRHGAYRGDGAFGQFCVVLPDQDAVVVTTAATEDMQGLLDLVWRHLLPAFGTATPADDDRLAGRLTELIAPLARRRQGSGAGADAAVRAVSVGGSDEEVVLTLSDGAADVVVRCGRRAWTTTTLTLAGGLVLEVAAQGEWLDADTLVADVVFVNTPHRLVLTVDRSALGSVRWNGEPLGGGGFSNLALDPSRD